MSATLTNLSPHTVYYFRAKATNSAGTGLGDGLTFTTLDSPPVANADGVELPMDRLTDRELEIFHLIGGGKTVKGIAESLFLSVKTVEAHKFNLMRKLDIHNKAQLVTYAIQKKIIKIPVNQ